MIKNLIKLAVVLVIGVLVYNYFLGTPAEKEQSKEIFREVGDLGKAAWGLLKSEKDKYDEGKYEGALDKIGNLLADLKSKAEKVNDSKILDRIADLERQKNELESKIEQSQVQEYDEPGQRLSAPPVEEEREIKQEWKSLIDDTEALMKSMEKQ